MSRIPFNRPGLVGRELEYISDSVSRGHISGDGDYTRRCQALLESSLGGTRKVLLTTSCTHALEMSALLLGVGQGDEVILPSFTFVSTANAFALRGARPVLADVRPDTLNLDESLLPSLITRLTKAIVVVHYAGVACEMSAILETAARDGVPVVEDNAHGLFGRYRGRHLGTFGALAAVSFHETKNFSCGEGGALMINDESLVERAEIIREKGTDRSRFFRGLVQKYTWVDIGSSYLPSDLLAAFLLAQLEAKETVLATRRRVFERYAAGLEDWARANSVRLPVVPPQAEQSYHMFFMLLPARSLRDRFIDHLEKRNIQSVFHYVPLHLSGMGRRFGYGTGHCPVAEDVSERLVRLPFFNDLGESDQDRVIDAARQFRC